MTVKRVLEWYEVWADDADEAPPTIKIVVKYQGTTELEIHGPQSGSATFLDFSSKSYAEISDWLESDEFIRISRRVDPNDAPPRPTVGRR
jgi:hypothetical protein